MPKESLTRDPFFIEIVAAIEKKIAEGDRIARANSILLSDAQIMSLLTKVGGAARGKVPRISPAPRLPRDQILTGLAEQLMLLRASVFEKKIGPGGTEVESLLSTEHWIAALKVVEKSIRLGTGRLRESRGFLDSLSIFMSRTSSSNRKK